MVYQTKTTSAHKFKLVFKDLFEDLDSLVHNHNNGLSVIVPHVCNNIDVFGAGFAHAVAQRYPIVKENYHLLGSSFLRKNPGYSQFITVSEDKKYNNKLIFCNMIAQNGTMSYKNPRPLNYLSLCRSMLGVAKYIKINFNNDNRVQIHSPKFGSGLSGGNWNFISYLIDDIWQDFSVFVYDYKPSK